MISNETLSGDHSLMVVHLLIIFSSAT